MADDWAMRVYQKSCEDMSEIPDRSIQTCVTSPPYYGLRDYGVDGQIGLEETVDEFVERLVAVFREVRRVLRDDGTLWVNLGDSYAGSRCGPNGDDETRRHVSTTDRFSKSKRNVSRWGGGDARVPGLKPKNLIGVPWRVAFALQADGWYLRSDIIWHKPNPMPSGVTDRPTTSHEYVFLLAKSSRYFYDADAIRDPLSEATLVRVNKKTYESQVGSHRANAGAKTNGTMKAVTKGNEITKARAKSWNPHENDAVEGNGVRPGYERVANPAGANKRDVWTIATEAYSEAHFATFPRELPSLCIRAGTSEAGCCSACGASRVRKTQTEYDAQGRTTNGPRSTKNRKVTAGVEIRKVAITATVGFEPSCECEAPTIASVVLDPFMGSGTTAEVAESLGRRWVGYEINSEYMKLIAERTRQTGLFTA